MPAPIPQMFAIAPKTCSTLPEPNANKAAQARSSHEQAAMATVPPTRRQIIQEMPRKGGFPALR